MINQFDIEERYRRLYNTKMVEFAKSIGLMNIKRILL